MTPPLRWNRRHSWRLAARPIRFQYRDDEWWCYVRHTESLLAFINAGVPGSTSFKGVAFGNFGPFVSLSEAAGVAASVCGCSERLRQDREYWIEGCSLCIQSIAGGVPWAETHEESRATYRVVDGRWTDEIYVLNETSRTMGMSVLRERLLERHGWIEEHFETLGEAQAHVERFVLEQALLEDSLAFTKRQARLAIERGRSRLRERLSTARARESVAHSRTGSA